MNPTSRILASALLFSSFVGGCSLFKKSDNDEPPPLPSAAVVPAALPSVGLADPVAPAVASADTPTPAALTPVPAQPGAKMPTGAASAVVAATAVSAVPAANSAAPAASSAAPAAAATTPALPALNAQCQSACQKSYQDCTSQNASASPIEIVQKCGALLSPCIAACSK